MGSQLDPLDSVVAAPSRARRATVHVVQSSNAVVREIRDFLSPFGWDVSPFRTAPACRSAIAEDRPDLVICDLDSPQGATLSGRLLVDHADVPCLVVTDGETAGFEDLMRLHSQPPAFRAIVARARGRLLQDAIVRSLLTRFRTRPRDLPARAAGELPVNDPDFRAAFWTEPNSDLVLTPDLEVIAVSRAYCRDVGRQPDQLIGGHLFEIFPDNPDDPAADGVTNLKRSLHRTRERRAPEAMPLQRYDVRAANGAGPFLERWWYPVNYPVCVGNALAYLVHRVRDVTRFVRLERSWRAQVPALI